MNQLTDEDLWPLLRRMDQDLIAAMNTWRRRQSPPLEPDDAILALIRLALTYEGIFETVPEPEPRPVDARTQALMVALREVANSPRP